MRKFCPFSLLSLHIILRTDNNACAPQSKPRPERKKNGLAKTRLLSTSRYWLHSFMVSLSTTSPFYHMPSVWSGTSGRESEEEKTQINKQDFFCALRVIRCVLSWKSKNCVTRRHDFFELNTFWPAGWPDPEFSLSFSFSFLFLEIVLNKNSAYVGIVICSGGIGVFRFLQFSEAFNINASCRNNWRTT